ncbi:MAG: hypothetical protein J6K33_08855 [Alistipes sp.]|nr:hypothetical protein [Alistipes sp.]
MNFTKNIFRLAMVAFATIAISACEPVEKPSENEGEQNNNSDFALEVDVDNITATSAKIKVVHNGKVADSWYGVLTTDTTTREDELIDKIVEELSAGDIGQQLIFSKNYTKIFSPLTPNTDYKYIAFGLTEDGVVYGQHASIEFTTAQSGNDGNNGEDNTDKEDEVYDNMLPNPAWSIAYTGAGVVNETQCQHTVTVNSTDNNPYTIAIVYASEYDPSKLRDLGQSLVESMLEYLEAYNAAYGTSFVLNDMLFRGNGIDAFDNLYPGYYIAVAMGITSKGEVSGLYAVSETFHIEEQQPTTLYSSWLGDWVFMGDNNISNEVVIGRNVANRSVNLMGLMGLPFSVVGEYSTERNDIIFAAQVAYQNYQFSDGDTGDIHLIGLDSNGKYYGLDNGNYGIAIAGVLENGKRAIVRYGLRESGYPKFVAMMLVAYVGGNYYTLGENFPTFNGIAELAPAAASTSMATFSKRGLQTAQTPLRLGKKIETISF